MSGGSSETTTSGPPDWAVPYFKDYLNASQGVASIPYQGYDKSTVADMNPYQVAGYNAQAQRALQGSPVMDAASGELQKTLSGGYLNNNPYLNGMVDLASKDVLRNMTGIDARSGSFGNSGVAGVTAEALGNVATNIRGQDYAAERGRMSNAINQAPGIANQDYIDASALQQAGQGFYNHSQAQRTDDYNRFREARDYPQQQLNTLGKGLGMNYGTTQTQPGANPWAQGIGAGLSLYGLSKTTGGGK